MREGLFAATDAAVEAAGSTDPFVVAEHFSILVNALHGSIIGYATRYSYLAVIGVNAHLDDLWGRFAGWHELGHVFRGHIDEPTFAMQHCDTGFFALGVDSRTISRHEKEANLISAEYNVDTALILDVIGYNNRTMRDYRRLCAYQAELTNAYEQLLFSTSAEGPSQMMRYRLREYQRSLRRLEQQRSDLEAEMISMNCCKSTEQMAAEIGTTETIFQYKLEALRIRGYDIDELELESYDKVFGRGIS